MFADFATEAVTQANSLALERQEDDIKEISERTIKSVLGASVAMAGIVVLALIFGRKG